MNKLKAILVYANCHLAFPIQALAGILGILDEFENETLVRCLGYRGTIGILVSEEDDEAHVIQEAA